MPDVATIDPPSRPSLSHIIAPHLPLLRRYARALTGTQTSGDAYVVALLEALVVDQSAFPETGHARVGLYLAFQRLWASAQVEGADAMPADARDEVVQARLAELTPRSRQALLLTAVEGFTSAEAAMILEAPEAEVDALVADARAALASQTRARVLVIEDEPVIAMDLEAIVRDLGHSVTDIADTRDTAVASALADRPDLVLADIQLADGSSGIDAVTEILAAFSVPVIFITAFPERLLTGSRPEPTFLIAKPFRTETVEAAISQALFFRSTARV